MLLIVVIIYIRLILIVIIEWILKNVAIGWIIKQVICLCPWMILAIIIRDIIEKWIWFIF